MNYTPLLLALLACGTMSAGNALDLESRAALWRKSAGVEITQGNGTRHAVVRRAPSLSETSYSYGFLKADAADADSLNALGVEILSTAGSISVVQFPTANTERIAATKGVTRLQLSRDVHPKMDKARALTGIDKIHSGIDLPQPYTGAGVVAGVVDAGMDPNHINFLNADGTSRIKSFAYRRYNAAGTAMLSSEYDSESVAQFTSDDATTYHGTHTMGIMAGGYKGEVRLPQATGTDGNIRLSLADNPYYGVATGADIAASCGTLQDAFIAYGVSGILDYAYDVNKRVVVNLSLGSNLGSHDGKCMLSQYLQAESAYAPICISAGNEGDMPIHITKTFTDDDVELTTFIRPSYFTPEEGNVRYGSINVYSNDETTFDLQGIVFNQSRGRIAERIAIAGNTEGVPTYYVSSTDYGDGVTSANFAKAFDGYCGVGSMIDEDSGRFYGIVDYYTQDNPTSNADGNYILGLTIKGTPGQRIDIFCDGTYTDLSNYGIEGYETGDCNGSISDMATTRGCIIVGSYDSRDNWLSLDKNAYGYDGLFEPGTISEFSSYGTLIDGRNLPHICAPGATIVSSTNQYFVDYGNLTPDYLQAGVGNSRGNYWEQMVGTSMSTPLVAGAIALWLEANPYLGTDDILEIIQSTAVVDNDVLTTGNPVQWGAGKFDAYAGLCEALKRNSGIKDVAADSNPKPAIKPLGDRVFQVFLPGQITVEVADTQGRVIARTTASDTATIDLGTATAGIYIFSVNGGTLTDKIIIR